MLIDFAEQVDREVGSLSPKDDLTLIVVDVKVIENLLEPGRPRPGIAGLRTVRLSLIIARALSSPPGIAATP